MLVIDGKVQFCEDELENHEVRRQEKANRVPWLKQNENWSKAWCMVKCEEARNDMRAYFNEAMTARKESDRRYYMARYFFRKKAYRGILAIWANERGWGNYQIGGDVRFPKSCDF